MNVFEHSSWLWCRAVPQTENVYVDFFENFTLDTVAVRYTLYISADSDYAVYVNGKLCDFGQYADYENYKVYDAIDLSDCFCQGENEIRITVRHRGISSSTYRAGKAGVIYALYANDELFIISSRDTMAAPNLCYQQGSIAYVSPQIGHTYAYDATKANVPVTRQNADTVQRSKVLYPRPIKRLSVLEDKRAKVFSQGIYTECKQPGLSIGQRLQYSYLSMRPSEEMTGAGTVVLPAENGVTYNADRYESTADGIYLIIDLGEEATGVFSLDIEVERETDILVGYGEHLWDTRPRSAIDDCNFALHYRAKAGRNTFIGPFLRLGARYLQLNISASRFCIHYVGMKPTEYPLDGTPYFTCADELHNRIYRACVRTLRACMHDHYESNPWSEQALYAMNARNQALCGYYAFGEYAMPRESIRLLALSLREDGYLELCAPAALPVAVPSQTLTFVVMLEEYLRHSGDVSFTRNMLPTAHVIIDNFRAQLNTARGLLKRRTEDRYLNFYEAQDGLDGSVSALGENVYDAPLNALLSMALRAMAHLCEACGEDSVALRCIEDKELLDRRIGDAFWDQARGAYCTFATDDGERAHYAELTNALLVCADTCTYANEGTVLSALSEGKLIPTTLSNAIFKYEALLRKPERYAKAVFEEIARIWGDMLLDGSATVYENTDKDNEKRSLCNGAVATPAYLYFAYVLGLQPTKDGFASYKQSPVNAGIYGASGVAVTPGGRFKL